MSACVFLEFDVFTRFLPVFESFIQVVNLKSFFSQDTCCVAASSSTFAVHGYRTFLVEQFICFRSKLFVQYIDIQASRNMSLTVFGYGSYVYPLNVFVLYQLLKVIGRQIFEFILCFGTACEQPEKAGAYKNIK